MVVDPSRFCPAEALGAPPSRGEPPPDLRLVSGCPKRLSVTLPLHVYRLLERRSIEQGRSMSNLAAFLIETAISQSAADQPADRLGPQDGSA